jgi:hypothetical protein
LASPKVPGSNPAEEETNFLTRHYWPHPGCHVEPYDWTTCHPVIGHRTSSHQQSHMYSQLQLNCTVIPYATCRAQSLPPVAMSSACHPVQSTSYCHMLDFHWATSSYHVIGHCTSNHHHSHLYSQRQLSCTVSPYATYHAESLPLVSMSSFCHPVQSAPYFHVSYCH